MVENLTTNEIVISYNNVYYFHYSIIVILIILILICWFTRKLYSEDFRSDNPNINYTVNPIPNVIDTVGGTSFYPKYDKIRSSSLIDPITEEKLVDQIYKN